MRLLHHVRSEKIVLGVRMDRREVTRTTLALEIRFWKSDNMGAAEEVAMRFVLDPVVAGDVRPTETRYRRASVWRTLSWMWVRQYIVMLCTK